MTTDQLRHQFEVAVMAHHKTNLAGEWSVPHGRYGLQRWQAMWLAYQWGYEANKRVKEAA